MKPYVRTILGDIDASELGVCYAHEHVVIEKGFMTDRFPDLLLNDEEKIIRELVLAREAGVDCMVDTQPTGARNIEKLVSVSRASGMHIVCPTGIHLSKYYPPGHWSSDIDEAALVELFVDDIEVGVDRHDHGGARPERTAFRAGVIKVAGGLDRLTPQERIVFTAAARAQQRTGAPIITHTEQGTAGLEQIDILLGAGADSNHIVLSHCDRKPDLAYHRAMLARGVALEYDSGFRWGPTQGNPTRDLVLALAGEYPDQILLGMDAARNRYWKSYGGSPGLDWLYRSFREELRQGGLSEGQLDRIFVTTPASVYAFSNASRHQPETPKEVP